MSKISLRGGLDIELPRSLADADERLFILKRRYLALRESRGSSRNLRDIRAEYRVITDWKRAIAQSVSQRLSNTQFNPLELTTSEGLIKQLCLQLAKRSVPVCQLSKEERATLVAARRWLRENASIAIAEGFNRKVCDRLEIQVETEKELELA